MFDDNDDTRDFQTETQVSFKSREMLPEFRAQPFRVNDDEPKNCVFDQYKPPLSTKRRNNLLPPTMRLKTVEEFLEE